MADNSSSGGVGFVGLLQLLFIGLKLGGAIQWSWWLVFSPFLAVAGLISGALAVIAVIGLIAVLSK
jgi:hypothetical protein